MSVTERSRHTHQLIRRLRTERTVHLLQSVHAAHPQLPSIPGGLGLLFPCRRKGLLIPRTRPFAQTVMKSMSGRCTLCSLASLRSSCWSLGCGFSASTLIYPRKNHAGSPVPTSEQTLFQEQQAKCATEFGFQHCCFGQCRQLRHIHHQPKNLFRQWERTG